MDARELKEYIIEKNLIEIVLEKLGCHKIKKNRKDIRCALPSSENGTAVSVKLNTLSTTVFSESDKVNGDIITLVSHIKSFKFIQSLKWLHEACNLMFTGLPTKKEELNLIDPLALFKNIKCSDIGCYINDELEIYSSSVLDQYIVMPHIELFREGISVQTQRKYSIAYDPKSKRILFPHRWHSGDENDLVGLIGRTLNPDWKILDLAKYFPLIPFSKSMNLYGYSENYETIQKSGMVIVVEAEKSVLKNDTFGECNAVALGSHSISQEQKRLLLSLGVEVVLAMDNDVLEDDVKLMCKNFSKFQRVSYIKDTDGLLGKKDSPLDCGYRTYLKLLENRIRFN